jgi:serine/threonine protein kinase
MEMLAGGELFTCISRQGSFSEHDAAKFITDIVLGVKHLHENGIVHRDLKPENILFDRPGREATLKIADFGLSKCWTDNAQELLKTACGTPGYFAPEVLQQSGYTRAVDMWSIGVILYILLSGTPPFPFHNEAKMYRSIMEADYSFPDEIWGSISSSAKELIGMLLCRDPTKRATADQVLQHQWVVNAPRNDLQNVSDRLKGSAARRRWKQGMNTVIAARHFVSAAASKRQVREHAAAVANAALAASMSGSNASSSAMPAASSMAGPPDGKLSCVAVPDISTPTSDTSSSFTTTPISTPGTHSTMHMSVTSHLQPSPRSPVFEPRAVVAADAADADNAAMQDDEPPHTSVDSNFLDATQIPDALDFDSAQDAFRKAHLIMGSHVLSLPTPSSLTRYRLISTEADTLCIRVKRLSTHNNT